MTRVVQGWMYAPVHVLVPATMQEPAAVRPGRATALAPQRIAQPHVGHKDAVCLPLPVAFTLVFAAVRAVLYIMWHPALLLSMHTAEQ